MIRKTNKKRYRYRLWCPIYASSNNIPQLNYNLFFNVTGAMLLTCFLGRRNWGNAPRAPLHLWDWRWCSSRHYLSGLVAMLLSTPLIGSGGDAPLDSHWDWQLCSSLNSLGLATMLLLKLIGNGAMLLLQIIGTTAMLLLKNPPKKTQ